MMKDEWRMIKDEGWMMIISSFWGQYHWYHQTWTNETPMKQHGDPHRPHHEVKCGYLKIHY